MIIMYDKEGEALCRAVVGNFRVLCLCSYSNNQERNENCNKQHPDILETRRASGSNSCTFSVTWR